MPGIEPVRHAMRLARDGRCSYRITEVGRHEHLERSLHGLMRYVCARIDWRVLSEVPDAGVVSAASLTCDGVRILLAGMPRSGKSILALKLVAAGMTFEGDSQVCILPNGVIAVPRPARVAPSAIEYLPEFASQLGGRAPATNGKGVDFYGYEPASASRPWCIREGPVDLVFLLFANHGGASSVRRIGTARLLELMTAITNFNREAAKRQLSELIALAAQAQGFDLTHGDPDQAAILVRQTLDLHASGRADRGG